MIIKLKMNGEIKRSMVAGQLEKRLPCGYANAQSSARCDDMALTAVMTFAKDNNLPFKWETGSGTFDAASDKYNDFATFAQDVKSHSGAPDFQNSNNAFPTSKNMMGVGGLILLNHRFNTANFWQKSNQGVAHHVQVVTKLANAYSVAAQSRVNIAFGIKQGNFKQGGSRYTGSDNPLGSRYLGASIQTGLYDLMNDTYTNFSTGDSRTNVSNGDDVLDFRKFNFLNWNK